jgi:hypothetical protein
MRCQAKCHHLCTASEVLTVLIVRVMAEEESPAQTEISIGRQRSKFEEHVQGGDQGGNIDITAYRLGFQPVHILLPICAGPGLKFQKVCNPHWQAMKVR